MGLHREPVVAEQPSALYQFGPFCLDPSRRQLTCGERPLPLTAKLFDILLLLVRNRGQVVTKKTIVQEIWPDCFVEENNLGAGAHLAHTRDEAVAALRHCLDILALAPPLAERLA